MLAADVDYVAAGIFCFQPYCVTGELEPPANPLICPQFCLRFNDLDNIGCVHACLVRHCALVRVRCVSRCVCVHAPLLCVFAFCRVTSALLIAVGRLLPAHDGSMRVRFARSLTGRHYSGFIMLGIQVFNKKDK